MKIGGLIDNSDLWLFRLTALADRPGTAAMILKLFAAEKVNIEYITESGTTNGQAVLAFCVSAADGERVQMLLSAESEIMTYPALRAMPDMSVIGIYGPHFREKPAIAARFCAVLGEAGVNIHGMSSSISSVCCVISGAQRERARVAILETFDLP